MKAKITRMTILCFLVGMLAILLILFFYLRAAFGDITEDTFKKQAGEYANMIQSQFENPVSFLSGLASVVEAQVASGDTDRVALQRLLLRAFDEYDISEGTAFMMEPNAYDGLDAAYVGTNYGTEKSGRISYYYYRDKGKTAYRPKVEEEGEQEFVQEYYTLPKERKAAVFSDPYLYTLNDKTDFMITASQPMIDDGGKVLGVLTVDMYLNSIYEALSSEKIYETGYIVVTTETGKLLYGPNLGDVGKDAAAAGLAYELPEGGEVRYSKALSAVNGKSSVVATKSVKLGLADSGFYVSIVAPESEANKAYITLLILMVAIFAIVGAIIALAVNITMGRALRPLTMMMHFLKRVGESGNLALSDAEWETVRAAAAQKDEVGQSLSAFTKMMEHLIYYDKALRSIADRDLSVDIKTLSDSDTIGRSLRGMLANLNEMFGEINLSADQVSDGSQQIADGAQSLAQGAADQSDSVEQLSASISEVTESIDEVAASANNLSELGAGIKVKAEQGTDRMNEMMEAVREISEASHSINSVIKIIDDIAFQTNILALNAAVEAARAGQYGKGFAVVAEEVRNLAAKSAEAAKNTSNLIENSVNKAELGVDIAGKTSESLVEIVDGVIDSSKIIEKIARDMSRQSDIVKQIDANVGQITQVVRMNTATAEESAAASEELSSQSAVLSGLIGRFTLKAGAGAKGRALPLAARSVSASPARTFAPPAPQTKPALSSSRAASHAAAPQQQHGAESFTWTPDLETGNELIDSQHKQLIEAIANLMDACSGGKGRSVLVDTIDFVESYTAKHFGDEEELQQRHRYPDYPNHKKLHDGFKRVVAELGAQLKEEGPTIALVGKVNTHIGGWLVNHIKREDTKVAAHLRESK
ncbi:MAG: bacteriohemerythrin [Clostridiales Family XIII bacterium]|jgi:methyl-accepting chemotaxis protein|nr:bacteriohemerythrin [Clostridiales Family XIII bacterium]